MSYTVQFTDQTVDPVSKAPITVVVGSTESTRTDLTLTGKGASNYAQIQQTNLVHLLEHFASPTAPPNATIGQIWHDTSTNTPKILIQTGPQIWKSLGGVQVTAVGEAAPNNPNLGDVWFEQTGTASGVMYVYTGIGRYPSTATTIGGWEQLFPKVDTFAGREEYDSMRELLEQLIGEGVSSYGSGAIGRSITNLTNFAELDRDMRLKYVALGADANVLVSGSSDVSITRQALSRTAFIATDSFGTLNGANDFRITGEQSSTVDGSIYLDGVVTTLPYGPVFQTFFVEDAYIMWDRSSILGQPNHFLVIRFDDATESWQFDDNVVWVPFTPSANQYIVGTVSTYQSDNNAVLPGGKNGFMWAHAVPLVGTKLEHLKVEPNSQDWDVLLAASKYAIRRLELPAGFPKTVASMPFVVDGRQPPSSLLALSTSDVRYPSGARRSGRRIGVVTQVSSFNETVNALQIGIANRFSLHGVNGASGSNTTFNPLITTTQIGAIATSSSAAAARTFTAQVAFSSHDEFYRWMSAGHLLQFEITHTGGAGAGDAAMSAAVSAAGTWRISADKTRIFGQSLPLTMTRQTANLGIWNTNASTVLTTQMFGVASMTLTGTRVGQSQFRLDLTLNAGTAMTGTTTVVVKEIADGEVFVPVSGSPLVYPRIASIVNSLT